MAAARACCAHGWAVRLLWAAAAVSWVSSAVPTANEHYPQLLPTDCGFRHLQLADATRPFIVGPGNTTAYYGQFPWQARLAVYQRGTRTYKHQCGAIIISQRYVLTAAHCVANVALNAMLIRVGDLQFGQRDLVEQEFGVASSRVHSQYTGEPGLPNDVALLQLRRRSGPGVQFDQFVSPACLPASTTVYQPFLPCEVSGWGKTADNAPISEVLRGVAVPLVSDTFCASPEVYEDRFQAGRMFCSGPIGGGTDSCGGDSGGPLVCLDENTGRFIAYGIVSSGDPLGCGRRPAIYTKISGYIDWILRRLQLDSDEEAAEKKREREKLSVTPTQIASTCAEVRFYPPTRVNSGFAQSSTYFPWMATLKGVDNNVRCGGVIISNRWILTSAICVEGGTKFTIQMGDNTPLQTSDDNLASPPLKLESVDSIQHPSYGKNKIIGSSPDIALLKTKSKIIFSDSIAPICLLDDSESSLALPGENIYFAGWGALPKNNRQAFRIAKWSRSRVVDLNECKANYSKQAVSFGDEIFCSKYFRKVENSQCGINAGDAGSVFASIVNVDGTDRWHAIGMNVGGVGCGNDQYPDINILLPPLVPWIRSVTGLAGPSTSTGSTIRDGDVGKACTTPSGDVGQCLLLKNCAGLRRLVSRGGAAVLLRPLLCGLDAASTPLLCCAADTPTGSAPCGQSVFRPPAQTSGALVTTSSQFPWAAAVYSDGRYVCGGAVVSERWIVTGATCIRGDKPITVRLGDRNLEATSDDSATAPPFDMSIIGTVPHPMFSVDNFISKNLALLKTETKIPFSSTVSTVCLPNSSQLPHALFDKNLIFAGWGAPTFGDNVTPLTLKWTKQQVINTSEECERLYSEAGRNIDLSANSDIFCTKFVKPMSQFNCGTNIGDQGGALVYSLSEAGVTKWYVAGLFVGGVLDCSTNLPDLNVHLAHHLHWINTVISTS